jgi:hypothetical protein
VCVYAAVPVVAPSTLGGTVAAGRPVVMVAYAVAIELGAPAAVHVAPSRFGTAATLPAAAAPVSSATVLSPGLLLATLLGVESCALLHHLRPSLLGFPCSEGRLPSQGSPSVLPEEAVDPVAYQPATVYSIKRYSA